MKFYIMSEFGEILDLALHLQDVEKQEVVFAVTHDDSKRIGDGMLKKDTNWWNYLGQDYIFLIDGCNNGNLQDWLRKRGEAVFGGSEIGDKLENERQMGQDWFKKAGFKQPFSKNFKDIGQALAFVEANKDRKWVLKQNGDAPKSINRVGKFDGSEDMIYHLQELQTKWNESEFGKFDCDLMEAVDGLEVAASVFFNGKEYMKNKEGKVVGFLNFEEKKEVEGGMGESTGEAGTLFLGVTEDNKLFKDIVMRPEILDVLRKSGFRGVFDLNGMQTKDGYVVFEATMRFGIPATSYEFLEGLKTPTSALLEAVAKGLERPVEVKEGTGMVIYVTAKPFPLEGEVANEMTSMGSRLWILQKGKPVDKLSDDQKKHIHLQNFEYDKDLGCYKVATKSGYLLTVTGHTKLGLKDGIKKLRDALNDYIKENVYIDGMKIRHDIGARVEKKLNKL